MGFASPLKVSSIPPTMGSDAAKAIPPAKSTPAVTKPATNPSRFSLSLAISTTWIYTGDSSAGIARLRLWA